MLFYPRVVKKELGLKCFQANFYKGAIDKPNSNKGNGYDFRVIECVMHDLGLPVRFTEFVKCAIDEPHTRESNERNSNDITEVYPNISHFECS
jgi:hypothetical protein